MLDEDDDGDKFTVRVELDEEMFSDEIKKMQEMQTAAEHEIEKVLEVQSTVTFVEPRTLERTIGKAKRVIDNRKK